MEKREYPNIEKYEAIVPILLEQVEALQENQKIYGAVKPGEKRNIVLMGQIRDDDKQEYKRKPYIDNTEVNIGIFGKHK